MTGPEHYKEAERLTKQADEWLDADWGWKADMSTEERMARRASDLAAAQVHATLALASATALGLAPDGGMHVRDLEEWHSAASRVELQ